MSHRGRDRRFTIGVSQHSLFFSSVVVGGVLHSCFWIFPRLGVFQRLPGAVMSLGTGRFSGDMDEIAAGTYSGNIYTMMPQSLSSKAVAQDQQLNLEKCDCSCVSHGILHAELLHIAACFGLLVGCYVDCLRTDRLKSELEQLSGLVVQSRESVKPWMDQFDLSMLKEVPVNDKVRRFPLFFLAFFFFFIATCSHLFGLCPFDSIGCLSCGASSCVVLLLQFILNETDSSYHLTIELQSSIDMVMLQVPIQPIRMIACFLFIAPCVNTRTMQSFVSMFVQNACIFRATFRLIYWISRKAQPLLASPQPLARYKENACIFKSDS